MKIIKIILILFFIIRLTPIFGLDPEKPIYQNMQTVWTSKQGLPSDNITSVIQDNRGFIWIGTFNGLIRFHGVDFEIFTQHTRKDFLSNSASVLFEDSEKTLWIGTNGNGLASYKNDIFKMYTKKTGLLSNYINAINEDDSGNIWIGTRKGLVSMTKSGDIFIPKNIGSKNELINNVYKFKERKMLFAFGKGGLYEISSKGIKPSIYSKLIMDYNILSIYIEKKEKIWIGTRNKGLFMIENGKLKHYPIINKIKVKTINNLKSGKFGSVWICSDSGLFRFYNGKFSSYTEQNGLPNNQIVDVFEDIEGNAWVATSRSGLIKLSEGKFFSITTRHGLVHDTVNAIMYDKDGNSWIGTDKGLSIYKDGKFINHPILKTFSNKRIRHIIQDSKNRIWICTFSKYGVITYDKGLIKNYAVENGLSSNRCRFALEDSKGGIWIGTSNGLNFIKNGKIKSYSMKDGLKDNYILSVFEDSKGNIWVGTNGGGAGILVKDRFISYSKKNGLASDVVFSIFEDSKGILWFTTNEGLSRFSNNVFLNYTVEDGLFGNAIFQILEDSHRKFWMTADIGIFTAEFNDMEAFSRGEIKKVNMTLYNDMDGLPGSSTPVSWATKDKSGHIWFPTLHGVAIVDTLSLSTNKHTPPVYIENIIVDKKKYSSKKPIVLKPDYKRITFNFSALSYVVPSRVKFRYILEGFENHWSDLTTNRYASYTTLPPGNYKFKITAVNNDGIWNNDGASINIYQKPYFYQTIWFTLLLVLIFFIIVLIVFALRIKKLRHNKIQLEKIVLERTKEITFQKEQISQKNEVLELQKTQLADSKSDLEKVINILNNLSITDSLTGIYNRRKFDEFLQTEWRRSIRRQKPISLIMIDVDFFKLYNDEYGHQAGDNCLKQISKALLNSIHRSGDLIARYGGEEFVAVLADSDMKSTFKIANRIKNEVKKLDIVHEKSSVSSIITVSMGIATEIPSIGDTYEELIKRADEALYRSKSEGRNRIST